MIQHRIHEVCNVENTSSSNLELSLKKPTTVSIKNLSQHAFIIAHVAIGMNFHRKRQMSKV
jgi:hypothetical protein